MTEQQTTADPMLEEGARARMPFTAPRIEDLGELKTLTQQFGGSL